MEKQGRQFGHRSGATLWLGFDRLFVRSGKTMHLVHCAFIVIVGINFGTSVSLPLLSLYLSLSLSVSLLLSPTNSPIYLSLSYPPHRLNSIDSKKRGERRRERDEEGMREIDRWGSWWVIEGGRLKKREKRIQREGGGLNRCSKILYLQWLWKRSGMKAE